MRTIAHPGPETGPRVEAVPGRAAPCDITLPADRPLTEAVAAGFAAAGFTAGFLRLRDLPMARLDYVIPAPSPDGAHAAWYSATFEGGAGRITDAALHLGRRDGAPFIHCHGAWEAAGPGRGHLLGDAARLARPCTVPALGLSGARFETAHDRETRFPLFAPRPVSGADEGDPAVLCRLRPNIDIADGVREAAQMHGLGAARVDGIGSLIGARFADGSAVGSYATEMWITDGTVAGGEAPLDVTMIGLDGEAGQGRLSGANLVCVTCELLLRAA